MIKILFLDIETAPLEVYAWTLWEPMLSIDKVIKPDRILSWSAKWLGKKEMFYMDERDGKTTMLKGIHDLLMEADAVCHFNGSRFDTPHLNREFVLADLIPPSPFQQIDLYKVVKKNFKFASNKLAYISEQLGIGSKVQHKGMALWVGCLRGDEESWATMERYNKQDVRLLERLYKKLRPWIGGHPNVGLYRSTGGPVCTNCGSGDLAPEGNAYLKSGIYKRFRCRKCDKWQRGKEKMNPAGHPGMVSI